MEEVLDGRQLRLLIGGISRQSPDYTTSLYASPQQIEAWCAADEVRALVAEGAVLLVRRDRDVHRVYHVANDPVALIAALRRLPVGRYVADLIGRDGALDGMCAAYGEGGFHAYTLLRRMGRGQPITAGEPVRHADVAGLGDVADVEAFLRRLLDPLSEQPPTPEELRSAAGERRLLVVRNASALAGMLMYDLQGQLAHLRFWHVDPDMHGAGIGRMLMGGFLSACAKVRRIVLWVIGDNDRSIAIYRHYGFEVDGLLDRIMISDKEQHR